MVESLCSLLKKELSLVLYPLCNNTAAVTNGKEESERDTVVEGQHCSAQIKTDGPKYNPFFTR